jgi:hypothetical protein
VRSKLSNSNAFSIVASDAVARLRELSTTFVESELPEEALSCLLEEMAALEKTLEAAFEYRKVWGPKLGQADSSAYFREKLTGFLSFVRMAIVPRERGNYTAQKIIENVDHYSYLVAELVSAEWGSRARKPVSDKAIRKSSFENRDVLQRLADR